MARLINWRSRLHTYLAGLAQTPFQPGTHDCSLFTAGAVEAVRGDDPAAPYRGNYTTVAGGLALLAADGYADQVEFITANFPEKPVLEAQVGDIADGFKPPTRSEFMLEGRLEGRPESRP